MHFFTSKQHSFTATLLLSGIVLLVLVPFISANTPRAHAAPNYQINYQGKLLNASNVAVADGTYNMRFWLTTSPSVATTSAVWTEELTGSNKVTVTNGLFSVMLGSTTPLTGVDWNQTLYLGVEVGGTSTPAWDGEMSPRKILGTVPAAFYADQASSSRLFAGIATTSFLRSDEADTASGLLTFTNGFISQASSTVGGGTQTTGLTIYGGATTTGNAYFGGSVGIGVTSPASRLSIASPNTMGALQLINSSNSDRTTFSFTTNANHGRMVVYDSSGNNNVEILGSGSSFFNGGNVGIGTTTPTSLLTVAGSMHLTGALYDRTYSAGTNGMVLKTTASGVEWVATSTLGLGGVSFTDSAGLAGNLSDETGTGFAVFSGSPTFTGTATFANATVGSTATATDLVATGTIRIVGGTSWPSNPQEGTLFYSTASTTLYIYEGGKWQQDRNTATVIVAASDTQNKEKADYVATGTNDQDTIESALATLPSHGGLVYLLPGTYSINNEINITQSSTTLMGSGPSTLLKITATSTNWDVIDVASGRSFITIRDLAIDGSAASAGNQNGVYLDNGASSSTVDSITVKRMRQYGVYLVGSTGSNIVNSTLISNSQHGIMLSSGANRNNVAGNSAIGNTVIGIGIANSNNIRVVGNVANSNAQYGIYFSNSYNNTITGNTVSGNTQYGMSFSILYNSTIAGNTVSDNPQYGLVLSGAYNNTVTANLVTGNGNSGISLESGSYSNTVTGNTSSFNLNGVTVAGIGTIDNSIAGNTINGNRGYGMSFSSSAHNNSAVGNMLYGNTSGGSYASIYINADDITISGNTIRATSTDPLIQIVNSTSDRTTIANNTYVNPDTTTYISDAGTGTRYDDYDRVTLGTPTSRAYSIFSISASSSASTLSLFQQGSGPIAQLYTSTSTRAFTFTNAGYLGLGSSTPNSLLTITNSVGTTAGTPLLTIASTTGGTSTTTLFTVTSAGNVGVRTTNPQTLFQVTSDVSGSTTPKQALVSFDNIQLSNLEGGAYFGRVGVRETPLGLTNYGTNWTARSISGAVYDVALSSDGRIQTAVVFGGQIYTSTDYGVTWTARDSSRAWLGVAMSSDGRIQTATVNSGQIYTSTDYGVTWTARDSSRVWREVDISSDGRIQTAVVQGGNAYTSTDYGVTWTARSISGTLYDLALSSDGRVQTIVDAAGGGSIYTSTDYGVTWTARGSYGAASIAMSSDGRIQTAVVFGGQIYTSTDYGVTWTARDSSRQWNAVSISSDGRIQTAVVFSGQIYTSTDYGVTWTARDSSRDWRSIAMSSDGRIQTVVGTSLLYTSTADSFTTSRIAVGTSTVDSIFTLASSTGTTLLKFTNAGRLGIGTTTPNQLLSIAGNMHLTGALYDRTYSAGTSGMVLKTTATGVEWVATSTLGLGGGAGDGVSNWSYNGTYLVPSTTVNVNVPGLVVSNGATTTNLYVSGNAGFGTPASAARLDVMSVSANILTPTLILRDSSGNISFEVRAGTSTLTNTFIGVNAGTSNTTGQSNLALGQDALSANTTGQVNIALGGLALRDSITGENNTVVGESLVYATNPMDNTILGTAVLQNAFFAEQNVLVGNFALQGANSASSTVAVGYGVAGQNTGHFANGTFVGYQAGYLLEGGADSNTFLGYRAGYDVTTGGNNTILGQFTTTGSGITTGSGNILIGNGVRAGLSQTGSNQLNIGNLIFGTSVASDATLSTGKIGIASSSPSRTLTVAGETYLGATTTIAGNFLPLSDDTYDLGSTSLRFRDLYLGPATLHIGTSASDEGTLSYNTGTNVLEIGGAAADSAVSVFNGALYIDKSTGYVGIGTTTPSQRLTVSDSLNGSVKVQVQNATDGTTAAAVFEAKTSDGLVAQLFQRAPSHTTPGWGLYSNQNSNFELYTNGTQRMIVDASGNVGIDATPSGWTGAVPRALQVRHVSLGPNSDGMSGYFTSNGYYDGANWRAINNGAGAVWANTNEGSGGGFRGYSLASTSAGSAQTLTELVRFTPSNAVIFTNLGVGAVPTATLTVQGSGTTDPFVVASSSGSSMFLVGANGGVGVGTTSPVNAGTALFAYKGSDSSVLELQAPNVSVASAFNIIAPLTTGLFNGKAFAVTATGELFARGLFYTDGSYGIGSGGALRDVFISRSATSTLLLSADRTGSSQAAKLIIAGNVGVGTSTPQATLHVSAPTGLGSVMLGQLSGLTSYGGISFDGPLTSTNYHIAGAPVAADGSLYINRVTGGKIRFREAAAGTDQFTIDAGGNVGIGSSSPIAQLVVSDGLGTTGSSELLSLVSAYGSGGQKALTWRDANNITGQIDTRYNGSDRVDMVFGHLYSSSAYQTSDLMVLTGEGRLGIGTTTPGYALTLASSTSETGGIRFGDVSLYRVFPNVLSTGLDDSLIVFQSLIAGGAMQSPYLYGSDTAGGDLYISGTSNGTPGDIFLNAVGGNVGIGTTTPARTLHVVGDIRIGTTGTNGCVERYDGTALTGTCSSDERLKDDVNDLASVLDEMRSLRVISYRWNEIAAEVYKNGTGNLQVGYLAQNVEELFPELVIEDEKGYKRVDYTGLTLYAIKGVTELAQVYASTSPTIEALETASSSIVSTGEGDTFWSRLTELVQGFVDGVLTLVGLKAEEVETNLLCIGETCVDENTLKALLESANQMPSAPPSSDGSSGGSTAGDTTGTTNISTSTADSIPEDGTGTTTPAGGEASPEPITPEEPSTGGSVPSEPAVEESAPEPAPVEESVPEPAPEPAPESPADPTGA